MRRCRIILAGASLLFWVMAIAGCVLSRNRVVELTFTAGDHFFCCTCHGGGLSVRWLCDVPRESRPAKSEMGWKVEVGREAVDPRRRAFINVPESTRRALALGGVEAEWGEGQILRPTWFFGYRASALARFRGISAWWAALLTYPVLWPSAWGTLLLWRRWRARRRQRRGLCPTCGYDVRASGTICPECGTSITKCRRLSNA